MRLFTALRIGVPIAAICLCVQGQNPPKKDAQVEAKSLSPRAAPDDYPAQAQAGSLTVAAEFYGHSVPTMEGPLTTEDYVAIDVGLFGSPGARTKLSIEDFALRLNGRKTPLPSQPYGSVAASVQDPEWAPPEAAEPKSKSGLSTGAKTEDSGPPSPPKVPIALKRAWAQRVQRAAIPLGDRSLPQGGLIFFLYGGKIRSLESIELIYTGPDGKATLKLQP